MRNILLVYFQPDKPQQNANVERCNRTGRGEWSGQYIFETIEEAQEQGRNSSELKTTSNPAWPFAKLHSQ
ncbi:transposase [Roseibium sp. CAU 1637]|uniref:Transposase n=1 Tax=Roseibium limicola TaxID=2816037 RepID=A0A939EKK0_9HYPH|nr:transposase [Roseibium limicola]